MTATTKLRDDSHQLIDQIEDQATLQAVHTLLAPRAEKLYSVQGKALDQNQVEDLLEESESDIEAGHTLSHQELKTHVQSWRKKHNAK